MSSVLSRPHLDDAITAASRTLAWAFERYSERVALSCSFGGPSGMVVLDLALQLEPKVPVFCLDTELLFPETHALIERVQARFGITVAMVKPRRTVAQQAEDRGPALWARDPDACCALRKVEPLRRYLRDFDAWLTGVRNEQTAMRAALQRVAWDPANEVVKIAPLLDWSEDDVWAYVAEYDIPVNSLHFDGYPSLGCTHCTRAVGPHEDARAGRWPGFDKTECGIHRADEASA